MRIEDLEIDIRHSKAKDEYIMINGYCYTKSQAFNIAKMLMMYSSELFDCIDENDIVES